MGYGGNFMRADRSEARPRTASSARPVVARIDMAKKKAVVLGVGAERGLGAAASRRFAKEGHHVLVAGRTAAKIDKVAESIRRRGRLGDGRRRRRHERSRGRGPVRQGD